jgi:hypothetical protein
MDAAVDSSHLDQSTPQSDRPISDDMYASTDALTVVDVAVDSSSVCEFDCDEGEANNNDPSTASVVPIVVPGQFGRILEVSGRTCCEDRDFWQVGDRQSFLTTLRVDTQMGPGLRFRFDETGWVSIPGNSSRVVQLGVEGDTAIEVGPIEEGISNVQPYTLHINQTKAGCGAEPNDTPADALEMGRRDWLNEVLCPDDVDWICVDTQPGEASLVEIRTDGSMPSVRAYFLSSFPDEVAVPTLIADSGDVALLEYFAPLDADCPWERLCLQLSSPVQVSYSAQVRSQEQLQWHDDCHEVNDTRASGIDVNAALEALPQSDLAPGVHELPLLLGIRENDADWFCGSFGEARSYRFGVEANNVLGNLRIEQVSEDGQVVAGLLTNQDAENFIDLDLSQDGTFCVRVASDGPTVGLYTVSIVSGP